MEQETRRSAFLYCHSVVEFLGTLSSHSTLVSTAGTQQKQGQLAHSSLEFLNLVKMPAGGSPSGGLYSRKDPARLMGSQLTSWLVVKCCCHAGGTHQQLAAPVLLPQCCTNWQIVLVSVA